MAKRQANPQTTPSPFEKLLADFKKYMTDTNKVMESSRESYIEYLKRINYYINYYNSSGSIIVWLNDIIIQKCEKPIKELETCFDGYFNTNRPISTKTKKPITNKTINNWKSALLLLGEFVFSYTNADVNLSSLSTNSVANVDILCQLVAQSVIFCSQEEFEDIQKGNLGSTNNKKRKIKDAKNNPEGTWDYYRTRRKKKNEVSPATQLINNQNFSIDFDGNNRANIAIKTAILEGLKRKFGGVYKNADYHKFERFEACHIWDRTCYDARYHTSVANLVLLPRELASLTDHYPAVKNMLQYEALSRFNFLPKDKDNNDMPFPEPTRPKVYNDLIWLHSPK